MQSKRRKIARCQQENPEQLLEAYQNQRPVNRYGEHAMLRWLTIARAYSMSEPGPCPMDEANASPELLRLPECTAMEQKVASRVMQANIQYPKGYLEYAAAFFQWWFRVANVLETPTFSILSPGGPCTWLDPDDIQKSLVVPDVRRSAVKVAQDISVRAGEMEVVSAIAGGRTRAVSATLLQLRTEEWRLKMHHALMYGTVDDIYHAGLLDAVQIAIVDSRYQGRLSFSWVKEVLYLPTRQIHTVVPWPTILVHGEFYLVVWQSRHGRCNSFAQAYEMWRDVCLQMGGVIGGRYDVRKCTI